MTDRVVKSRPGLDLGLAAVFQHGEPMKSRVWCLPRVMVPGRGRYELRLKDGPD